SSRGMHQRSPDLVLGTRAHQELEFDTHTIVQNVAEGKIAPAAVWNHLNAAVEFCPIALFELSALEVTGQPLNLDASRFELGSREGLRSEEHTSELQSRGHLVCRLLLEKKKLITMYIAAGRKDQYFP